MSKAFFFFIGAMVFLSVGLLWYSTDKNRSAADKKGIDQPADRVMDKAEIAVTNMGKEVKKDEIAVEADPTGSIETVNIFDVTIPSLDRPDGAAVPIEPVPAEDPDFALDILALDPLMAEDPAAFTRPAPVLVGPARSSPDRGDPAVLAAGTLPASLSESGSAASNAGSGAMQARAASPSNVLLEATVEIQSARLLARQTAQYALSIFRLGNHAPTSNSILLRTNSDSQFSSVFTSSNLENGEVKKEQEDIYGGLTDSVGLSMSHPWRVELSVNFPFALQNNTFGDQKTLSYVEKNAFTIFIAGVSKNKNIGNYIDRSNKKNIFLYGRRIDDFQRYLDCAGQNEAGPEGIDLTPCLSDLEDSLNAGSLSVYENVDHAIKNKIKINQIWNQSSRDLLIYEILDFG